MVTSKYSRIQLFIHFFIPIIFLGLFVKLITKDPETIKSFWVIILPVAILLILYHFFYKAPSIVFDENFITIKRFFKKSVFGWDQVSNVFLSKKEKFSILHIFGQSLEAMKLEFKEGKSLIVWSGMYRNMAELRAFVSQKLNDKLHFIKEGNSSNLKNSFINKKYSGNAFFTANTLLIVGIAIFFFLKFDAKPGKEWVLLIPVLFILLIYIFLGAQMNFFEIKNDLIIIRNHYFPWKKLEFNINEIEEVSKESQKKRSDGLRIITKDFQSKFYGAGTLKDKTWEELLADLGSMGLKTQND